jgi:hypothetical protein
LGDKGASRRQQAAVCRRHTAGFRREFAGSRSRSVLAPASRLARAWVIVALAALLLCDGATDGAAVCGAA